MKNLRFYKAWAPIDQNSRDLCYWNRSYKAETLSPEGRIILWWSPTGSYLTIFLSYILKIFFSLRTKPLSPGGGSLLAPLRGPNLILFLFYISLENFFLGLNLQTVSSHFWLPKFFIPRRGELACSPSGSQFDSLSDLYWRIFSL